MGKEGVILGSQGNKSGRTDEFRGANTILQHSHFKLEKGATILSLLGGRGHTEVPLKVGECRGLKITHLISHTFTYCGARCDIDQFARAVC